MKKILIFIDWFTPGYKAGGPISSNANLIAHLSKEFNFYVITRDTDYCETKPYPTVISNSWNSIEEGSSVYYFSKDHLSFKNIIQITKSLDFDVVYINGIYSLYFSLFPLIYFKYFSKKKVIISARGMVSDHTFSSKKLKKKIFYAVAYFTRLYRDITIHATNTTEAENIRRTLKFSGAIKVAPNLPPKSNPEYVSISKTPGEIRIINIARISKEKNTLFALQVLEKCSNVQITFDIYGTIYDTDYWSQCEEIIKRLPANIRITFMGTIEKSLIIETLKKYHVMFMPSLGENYGHSIVESFIAGRPVIISDQTPWRNLNEISDSKFQISSIINSPNQIPNTANNCKLPIVNYTLNVGWDIPLDKPEQFTEAIEYCARMDQEEYDAMSHRAFEYAKQITDDPAVLEANRRLFE